MSDNLTFVSIALKFEPEAEILDLCTEAPARYAKCVSRVIQNVFLI